MQYYNKTGPSSLPADVCPFDGKLFSFGKTGDSDKVVLLKCNDRPSSLASEESEGADICFEALLAS